MSWKKHFTVYRTDNGVADTADRSSKAARFSSWLPEVYTGQPNRVERYAQYDQMDMDSEVNAALDTISEFSTQFKSDLPIPFEILYKDDATESEIEVLKRTLSPVLYNDEKRVKILQKLDELFVNMIDNVKNIKKTFIYSVERNSRNIN